MTSEEKSELARLWVIEHTVEPGAIDSQSKTAPSAGPGYKELNRLVESDPDEAFEVILEILRVPHSDSVTAVLAAGPLENLIQNWGPSLIERIETEAHGNPTFRQLLGGVWESSTPEVWNRVLKAKNYKSW